MRTLYPYRVLFGDVKLGMTGVEIDGTRVPGLIDNDGRRVRLERAERESWDVAKTWLELAGPASKLASLADPAAVVVANCGPANTRVSTVLQPVDDIPSRWVGELTIDRVHWFGRGSLQGYITATVNSVPNRIVGSAEGWDIELDDFPTSPVANSLPIRWVDFREPNNETYLVRFASDPYYLRIDPDKPMLFLNKGFDGLEQLLVDRRRRGADRALHDNARANVASNVWIGLFNAALDAVEEIDGAITWPESDWQRVVLEALLVRMYPERGLEDALVDAYSARHEPDAAGTLQELLFPAAMEQARLPRLLRDGLRIMSHEMKDAEEGDDEDA
jgi:hypothetical protein